MCRKTKSCSASRMYRWSDKRSSIKAAPAENCSTLAARSSSSGVSTATIYLCTFFIIPMRWICEETLIISAVSSIRLGGVDTFFCAIFNTFNLLFVRFIQVHNTARICHSCLGRACSSRSAESDYRRQRISCAKSSSSCLVISLKLGEKAKFKFCELI